jgi:hypothetical protein
MIPDDAVERRERARNWIAQAQGKPRPFRLRGVWALPDDVAKVVGNGGIDWLPLPEEIEKAPSGS